MENKFVSTLQTVESPISKEHSYIKLQKSKDKLEKEVVIRFWKWYEETHFISFSNEFSRRGFFSEIQKKKLKDKNFLEENQQSTFYANELIAVKFPLNPREDWNFQIDSFSYEISCNLIIHPHIVNYIGGLDLRNPYRIGILMEFIEKNLRESIQKNPKLKSREVQIEIAKQIASGMNFLHSLNPYILHRDLRTPNILISEDLTCKIADFGNAYNLCYKEMESKFLYTKLIPPECRSIEEGGTGNGIQSFTKKGDVYFFGWVLLELVLNKPLYFYNSIQLSLLDNINIEESLKKLIFQCLEKTPNLRPSFYELVQIFNEGKFNLELIAQSSNFSCSNLLTPLSQSLGRHIVHEFCIYGNLEGLRSYVEKNGNECLNFCDMFGTNCAHFAARNGYLEILDFLKRNGFKRFNEKEKRFESTCISFSVAMKHCACVDFLIPLCNTEALNEGLLYCSQQGNFDFVKKFVIQGANLECRADTGATPLDRAASNGFYNICEYLIEKGALVNQTRPNGCTPLIIAAQEGYEDVCRLLLRHGAAVNYGTTDGTTPIYIACENGHQSIVKLLIENRADVNLESGGSSPLYVVCQNGFKEILEMILPKVKNVNRGTSAEYASPLFVASQNGHREVVKRLLRHPIIQVNLGRASDGCTALFMASQKGWTDIVEILLQNMADPNQCRTDNGSSPLIIASQNGHLEVAKLLLQYKALPDLGRLLDGCTPLYFASQNGHVQVVKLLISFGANPNHIRFDNGFSPLFIATQNGHKEVVQALLQLGSNPNLESVAETTPLLQAIENQSTEIVKLLLQYGAKPNAGYPDTGVSPTYCAAELGNLELVKLLFQYGAELDQPRLDDNATPLCIAAQNGHKEVVQFLLEHGANPNTVHYSSGSTPLIISSFNGHEEVVKLLVQYGADIRLTNFNHLGPIDYAILQNHPSIVLFLNQNK